MRRTDDLTDTVLSGDAYQRAAASTRRFYPLSIRGKLLGCMLTVASGTLLAPATYPRRELIRSLEGEAAASGALEPAISTLALVGVASTTLCALVLLRLLWLVETDALSFDRAETVIRLEDAIMTVAIATGVILAVAAVLLALIGFLTPGTAVSLYGSGVTIYVQGSGPFAIDTRITSGLAFVAALGLLLGYLLITGEGRRRRSTAASGR